MSSIRRRKAIIFNNGGIGNALLTLPIVGYFEKKAPDIKYYYINNEIFNSHFFRKKAGIMNYIGPVPNYWRKFSKKSHKRLFDFIKKNDINLIINLRNESKKRDKSYFYFKKNTTLLSNIEFWDLYEIPVVDRKTYIVYQIIKLFKLHGYDLSGFNRYWLKIERKKKDIYKENMKIGFFPGANTIKKRWKINNWLILERKLSQYLNTKIKITIIAGKKRDEIIEGKKIYNRLDKVHNCQEIDFINNKNLYQLYSKLKELDLLITNDTSILHLAYAMQLPTIGIYLVTNSVIWGAPPDNYFKPIQNNYCLSCVFMKEVGTCEKYYNKYKCKDYQKNIDNDAIINKILVSLKHHEK